MPGSVVAASPTAVLPEMLCRTFVHEREWPVNVTEYVNGESQRGKLTESSRRKWRLATRLTHAQLVTLRTFFINQRRGADPFYFYDPPDQYDETGVNTVGRYTVRFESGWEQLTSFTRIDTAITLIEVA